MKAAIKVSIWFAMFSGISLVLAVVVFAVLLICGIILSLVHEINYDLVGVLAISSLIAILLVGTSPLMDFEDFSHMVDGWFGWR